MPYNNTPIAPSNEVTGTVSLPLARVKKIIHADEDISNCSNNAAFCITVATELFLQYLVEQTANVVKSERKPRRNIQYKDVAGAVARIDNLEFLTDVVPKTTTYKEHKAKKAKESATLNGQTTLVKAPNGTTFAAAQALPAIDTSAAQTPAEDEMDVEPNQANPETPTSAS